MTASQDHTPSPLLSLAHASCAKCLKEGWRPADTGRQCQHRHNRLDVSVTDPMWFGIDDLRGELGLASLSDTVRHVLAERISKKGPPKEQDRVQEKLLSKAQEPQRDTIDVDLQPGERPSDLASNGRRQGADRSTAAGIVRGATLTVPSLPKEDAGAIRALACNALLVAEPNLWQGITRELTERVWAQNFEQWLSSVRWVGVYDKTRVLLQVPNCFFQEYLGEHYVDVIQEELLQKYGRNYEIEFVIAREKKETPAQTPEPAPATQLSAPQPTTQNKEPQTKEEFALQHAEEEAQEIARYKRTAIEAMNGLALSAFGERNAAQKILAEEHESNKKKLQLQHAQQLARFVAIASPVLLRKPGNPREHRQYAEPSPWEPGLSAPNTSELQRQVARQVRESSQHDAKPKPKHDSG